MSLGDRLLKQVQPELEGLLVLFCTRRYEPRLIGLQGYDTNVMSQRKLVDNFEILNGPDLKIVFSDREFSDDGWLASYLFSVSGSGINASARVDNPPYGHSPNVLFEQMNNEWSGWAEPKGWGAMEGEYSIKATYEPRGHIILSVEIENLSCSWFATANLDIEAGELESLARRAKAFFRC